MGQITLRELEKMDFFKEIPKDILQNLLNESKVVSYKKKEVIFHSRSRTKTVYFVYSGEVMLYNLTKHGNRKVIFILGKGRLLNQSIVSKKPNALFCEAACPVQVIEIAEKQFLQLMEQSHALTRAVLREYERNLWRMGHQLKNTTGNMQMERKIAAKLWKLGRDIIVAGSAVFGVDTEDGVMIDIDLTITLMADLVGAPRENVSRACKVLTDRGLIRYGNKRFILIDFDGLAKFYKM